MMSGDFMNQFPARHFLIAALVSVVTACAGVTPPAAVVEETPKAKLAEDLPKVPLEPEILYNLLVGEVAGQRGQIGVAAATLSRVAQQTRDPRVAERATLASLYAKRYPDALASAQLWVELRPNDVDAREALATVLLELDRAPEAKTQFEKILALEEERNSLDQAYLRCAAALARGSNRNAAQEIMQSLVDKHPRVASAHFAMAHLAVRGGDLERARVATDQALELRPTWEEAALFKARILISQKDMVKTRAFFESYLAGNAGANSFRLNYARFLIDQKEWDRAREQFKRIVASSPDDAESVYAAGLLSMQTGNLDDAEKYLKHALNLRPQNDQARLYLGQIAEQNKQYNVATAWYKEVDDGEYYFEAQTRIGMIMAKQGDLAGARAYLQSIPAQTDSQRVQAAIAEEQILRDAKLYRQALEMLNAAIKAVPGDKDLLYTRALVAEKLEMLDVAERDLREILKSDPKNVNALNALGYTLSDRTTRYQEAMELLQQAMTLKPDDAFITDSMGWLQYRMGNLAEAVKYLKRALAIRNDAEIAAHLGEVLWVTGNKKEAESVWTNALHETPDNEALNSVIKKFKP
jgi:tetratricopeptide (TPR) repeat protein